MSHTEDPSGASAATTSSPPTALQKLAAEALGTFVLVLFGCGSLVLASSGSGFGDANILSVGLSFGLAVTVMAYAVGTYSNAHFNPAVSVAAAIGGRISWKEVPALIGAQVAGGILGALTLLVLAVGNDAFDPFEAGSLAANGWGDDGTGYPVWAALLAELILTLIFAFVILAVTDKRNENQMFGPLVIGLTLAVIHFVAIPLTGTSVNPARSIGPALFSGADSILQLWVFIVAPLLGGAIAGLAYPALFGHADKPVAGSGLSFTRKTAAPAPTGYAPASGYQQQWDPSATGGYQQPATGSYAAPGAQAVPAAQHVPQAQAPVEQPIIQDGWQWDPQAQQWIPAQQQAPQAPQQGGWPTPASEQTQVRPNDGS